jgi:hypothetical protein
MQMQVLYAMMQRQEFLEQRWQQQGGLGWVLKSMEGRRRRETDGWLLQLQMEKMQRTSRGLRQAF